MDSLQNSAAQNTDGDGLIGDNIPVRLPGENEREDLLLGNDDKEDEPSDLSEEDNIPEIDPSVTGRRNKN